MTTTVEIIEEESNWDEMACAQCGNYAEYCIDEEDFPSGWEYEEFYMEPVCFDCSCYEMTECYGCGDRQPTDYLLWCEWCDEYLCDTGNNCYVYEHSCQEDNDTVHQYGYEPDFTFRKTGKETPIIEKLFLGVELETQGNTYDIPYLTDFIGDESHAYMCEDSSVSGPEIITHPMTLDYHKNNFDWDGLVNAADDDGLYSNSDAGLHVHVSRAALGDTLEAQAQIGTNLLAVLESHFDMWTQLARRDSDHWAPRNMGSIDIKWGTPDNAKEAIETVGKGRGKYAALNFSKQNTLEFRLFASTLDTDIIIATLEAVSLMVIIAKSFSLDQILTMDYDTVMTIAAQHGFDSLTNWDKRNNIPVDASALRKAFNASREAFNVPTIYDDDSHVDLDRFYQ